MNLVRVSSGSGSPARSTMELIATIITGFHQLTIATESSIVDISGALDPFLRLWKQKGALDHNGLTTGL